MKMLGGWPAKSPAALVKDQTLAVATTQIGSLEKLANSKGSFRTIEVGSQNEFLDDVKHNRNVVVQCHTSKDDALTGSMEICGRWCAVVSNRNAASLKLDQILKLFHVQVLGTEAHDAVSEQRNQLTKLIWQVLQRVDSTEHRETKVGSLMLQRQLQLVQGAVNLVLVETLVARISQDLLNFLLELGHITLLDTSQANGEDALLGRTVIAGVRAPISSHTSLDKTTV
ncbi:hypothetical protein HG531_006626 [Fusarium graminearum]|nr:hypothetical protein HG531_006626 [Fusarium graminearum]